MSRYWTISDIDWDAFDASKVDSALLATVKAASLVEANAPDYVTYLRNVFRQHADLRDDIIEWGDEEEQHGVALARWAQLADPDYDADKALERFQKDYQQLPLDTEISIRGSEPGELFARCIVESGTASFYAAMHNATDEPVLKQIARQIAADEIRHYKLFRRYLEAFEKKGADLSIVKRLRILSSRIEETADDEFGYAYYSSIVAPVSDVAYDREHCSVAYENGAYGLYQRSHLEKGAKMMLRVIGLSTDSFLVKAAMPLAWFLMQRKQRRLRKLAAA